MYLIDFNALGTLMDSVEAGVAAVETSAEVVEDIVTPDLATMIGERETTGDTTRTERGTGTTTTGGETTGIMREAAGAGPVAGDILTREGIPMRGGMTHTHPLPRTASDPGGEIAEYMNFKCDNVFPQVPQSLREGIQTEKGVQVQIQRVREKILTGQ